MRTTARRDGDELRRQRLQDLHHQRDQRRPRHHRGQDRPRGQRHAGMSLLVVERGMDGLRARPQPGQGRPCTPRTPPSCSSTTSACRSRTCSARRARASRYLIEQPRPGAAVHRGLGARRRARRAATGRSEYVKDRTAFGQPIGSLPELNRFALAEMKTEVERRHRVRRPGVRRSIRGEPHRRGRAPMAKWWTTELQGRVIDRCVQLHGGYGYMLEYPIARACATPGYPDLRRHHRDHEGDHRRAPSACREPVPAPATPDPPRRGRRPRTSAPSWRPPPSCWRPRRWPISASPRS